MYSIPDQNNIYDVANLAFYINTYIKMLNVLLEEGKLPTVTVGIGLASSKTLAVKASRKS